jgi:cyclomaltodextrinase / maltogenic alpha-amylase / neopullulanase
VRYIFLVTLSLLLLQTVQVSSKNTNSDFRNVPEWAKRAVWYQIFPERFRNGDPSNDPRVEDIFGAWPHETPAQWNISKWGGDWYALQPWEKDKKGFYYHAQERRYGGDLQGVIDKLDYLSNLGVNAIYLNPIFESPSLHKYDATMYHHVDNNFGPDPAGDKKMYAQENPADPATWQWTSADKLFLKLVNEAHKRGMKIILDGVFNHVGMTFWAFEDVKKNQEKSQFKDWFTITKWDDPSTPGNEFEYLGWYGVKELPELRKDSVTGLARGPHDHVLTIVKRWMDPNGDGDPSDGIDGWRLDVANMVPLAFWRDFRTTVRTINPEAYITGEVWWEDWDKDKIFNAAPWLDGTTFDAVMNYRWAREACHFFIDHKNRITAEEFDARLTALRNDYLSDVNYVLMNLFDSHDTDRLPSHIVNPDLLYDHHVGTSDNKEYNVRKPNEKEIQIQKLMVLFQMTYLGAPMVYYGDEVGMWGGDDPDERKPMLWPDITFDDEVSHPFGTERPHDKNEINSDLFDYYKKLINIRSQNAALMVGDINTLVADSVKDVYAFKRSVENESIIVAINNSESEQTVEVTSAGAGSNTFVDLLSDRKFTSQNEKMTISLKPKSGVILKNSGS